jgi:hypothetical protein
VAVLCCADLSNAMVWETKRHEEEMVGLKEQIASLNLQYSTSAQERAEKDAKLIELDHLVGQLLSVNETLICQISGKRISSVKAAAAPRVVKKKKKSVVPRAAKVGTASSNAKNEAGAARRQAASKISGSSVSSSKALAASRSVVEEVASKKELLGMHEMYVSLANSITGKSGGTKTVSKLSSSSSSSVGGGGGGGGSRIKKSIGKSSKDTQMRRRIIDQQQQGGGQQQQQQDDETLLTSASLLSEVVNVNLDEFERKYMTPGGGGGGGGGVHVPSPSPSSGLKQPELQSLISSLEEEFEGLNDQYQRILQHSGDKSKGNGKRPEDTSQELVSVIQRLHKKGEQLRALKSPTK